MKITANTAAFAKALSIVGRAAAKNSPQPILSAVHLSAQAKVLALAATNGQLCISLRCSANIVEEGAVAVPAKMLSEIATSLPEGTVELSTDTGEKSVHQTDACLCAAGNSYTLRAYDPDNFLDIARFPTAEGEGFQLPSEELINTINTVLVAISKDETRQVLTGVLAVFERDSATFVSTDSYRLCHQRVTLENGPSEPATAIVPAAALKEVSRLAAMSDSVRVATTADRIMFTVGGVLISSSLISGTFPGYEKMLPESFAREFTIETKVIKDALKRINLFTEQKADHLPVRMVFSSGTDAQEQTLGGPDGGGTLTLSAQSPQIGTATEVLDAEVPEGADLDISFNGSYLADGIDVALRTGAEEVLLQANEPLKPAMLRTRAGAKAGTKTDANATSEADDGAPDGSAQDTTDNEAVANGSDGAPSGRTAPNENSSEMSYLIMPMRDPNSDQGEQQ